MAAEITREELLLLGRCPFFRGADEALLRRVLALPGVTAEAFPAGGAGYPPHQFRRCLGFLLTGQVQVTNAALSVSVLEAGELFGAAALYNDLPDYATTLTARSPCRILFLPQEDVDRLLGEESLLRRNYLRYLSGRIRFLSGRLGALAQTGAEGKLARYLLSSGEPSVHAPATDLAKRLGLPLPGLRVPGDGGPHPPGGQDGVRAGPRGAGRGFVSVSSLCGGSALRAGFFLDAQKETKEAPGGKRRSTSASPQPI